MAVPHQLFIRFLTTRGIVDLPEVNSILEELNLGPITQKILDKEYNLLQSTLPNGINSQIENKSYGSDFLPWMKVLEVEELWRDQKPFIDFQKKPIIKLTYDIHQDLILRVTINALLIKGVPHEDIITAVGTKFSTLLKPTHLDLYEKFFFSPRRMARRDWKTLLSGSDEVEKHIYFMALTEPLDVLKNELELPSKISVSDTLQYLLNKSFQKAKGYLKLNNKEANIEARAWINQVVQLVDKYEKFRTGDTDDFSKTLQLEFEYIDNEFPTPDQETLAELARQSKSKNEQKVNCGQNGVKNCIENKQTPPKEANLAKNQLKTGTTSDKGQPQEQLGFEGIDE